MNIIKTTLVATSIGLFNPSVITINKSAKNNITVLRNKGFVSHNISSTKFNNSKRYSLEKLKLNMLQLESFKKLPKNWNGYNGDIIKADLIDNVKKLSLIWNIKPANISKQVEEVSN